MKFKLIVLTLLLQASIVHSQNWDVNLLNKLNPNGGGESRGWRMLSNNAVVISAATPFTMFAVGALTHNQNLKHNALTAGAALIGNTLITYGMKDALQRQRPYVTWANEITPQGKPAGGYSFPSGHTSTVFNIATSLSLSVPKWYVIAPAFTFATATAYSRMYRGAHYPSDVLGGIIVGAGSSYLTFKMQKLMYRNRYRREAALAKQNETPMYNPIALSKTDTLVSN
ncbi:phosphatase PAP2 family protein [Mucilaginibacter sp. Bleaf8]|uniref:phosphatase PAP2 family protein n=1 Tax=Mucilaginibacter sp. Bleaf8 TaxID=2834430 RepID=UPI001BCD951D|nr:phosphatase PAP2 family protein [Mucilaginibacter sp. Bleaf8]MBS7564637.1 phosphatase PAP2 family protein [Mucilaginibacter sp. Bleaf8]